MQNILISKINIKNNPYSFSFPKESEAILKSIKQAGLLQPIILTNSMEIVCGLRRVLACKRLKIKNIDAIIINKNLPEIEIFKLNLAENLSVRKPNLIEKSNILNKLKHNFNVPQETIIKDYLPILEIPSNIKYLNNYIWINSMPDEIKNNIIEKDISIDILNGIKNWTPNTINTLFLKILSFNFGNSKILQIVNLLNEISTREQKPVDAPLQSREWKKISVNKNTPLFQKGLQMRELLIAKRYPIYTDIKNKLKHSISKLNLPKEISIMPDIFTLENNFINFKIECKQQEKLKQTTQKLAEIADSKELRELLELLKV